MNEWPDNLDGMDNAHLAHKAAVRWLRKSAIVFGILAGTLVVAAPGVAGGLNTVRHLGDQPVTHWLT